MWRNVPKKNVSSRIADVFRPRRTSVREFVGAADEVQGERAPGPDMHGEFPGRAFPIGKFIAAFAVIGVVAMVVFGFFAYERKVSELDRVAASLDGARAILPGIREYGDLLGDDAGISSEELPTFGRSLGGVASFGDLIAIAQALFADVGDTFASARTVSDRLGSLFGRADRLQNEGLRMVLTGRGEELIALLKETRTDLEGLDTALQELEQVPGALKTFMPISPADYLDYRITVKRAGSFLDAAIGWLEGHDRHIAVFFLNPAELRPGGGFIGSYAEMTIANGSLRGMTVRDVNEPDREFARDIVPPRELQGLVKRWRAADANWFFDFPSSAEKVLSFMDASALYPGDEPHFDAAVGVSAPVVRDILARLGPLKLPSKQIITAENFLQEIQRQVQLAQERGDNAPKLILAELTPLVAAAMRSEGFTWDEGAEVFSGWLARKDMMVYIREPALQNLAETVGAAGSVMQTEADGGPDYLAVVVANVGGGKSDLFTTQDTTLQSQLGADGTVANHIIVKRRHAGTDAKEWWYRMTNQAFVKVFVPSGAKLDGGTGIVQKTVTPLVNYGKGGYETDADLARLEETAKDVLTVPGVTQYKESGKTVFGAWVRTPLGETSEFTMDYTMRSSGPIEDGRTHTLVMERQTGATGTYRAELHAPVGFRWRENGLPVYEYGTTDLPGRLVMTLTLERVP